MGGCEPAIGVPADVPGLLLLGEDYAQRVLAATKPTEFRKLVVENE